MCRIEAKTACDFRPIRGQSFALLLTLPHSLPLSDSLPTLLHDLTNPTTGLLASNLNIGMCFWLEPLKELLKVGRAVIVNGRRRFSHFFLFFYSDDISTNRPVNLPAGVIHSLQCVAECSARSSHLLVSFYPPFAPNIYGWI